MYSSELKWNFIPPAPSVTDEKAKVSADDTTQGYLNGKLTAGANISLTEGTPGGNETLAIAVVSPYVGNVTGNVSGSSGSCTGNASTVTTNANLTGPITSVGNATSIASQTGTGTKFVVDTSPTIVTPTVASFLNANHTHAAAGATGGLVEHHSLNGLGDDDHTIYALLAGRAGGQILIGGTLASQNLTLQSTVHGTKGKILFGTSAYDEVNNLLGIGTAIPTNALSFTGQSAQIVWMERETTAATAGNNFTIQAGGAVSGGTNLNGGSLYLYPGLSTGTGKSGLYFGVSGAGATGTTDRTVVDAMSLIPGSSSANIPYLVIGDNTVTPLFPTLTKLLLVGSATDVVLEVSGTTAVAYTGIADYTFINRGVDSGTTRLATIQAITGVSKNVGQLRIAVKKAAADANPSTVATFNEDGYLGIGTVSPGSLLSVGSTSQFRVNTSGIIPVYNNIVTVSNGVPSEHATVDLTAQVAAIGATTLYAVPAAGVGMYRISFVAKVTTAATTSSVLGGAGGFQLLYTDPDTVVVTTPVHSYNSTTATLALNTTQAVYSGEIIVYAKASTNIQYKMGYTSAGATAMQFNLDIKLEAL